jgi:hypothetical protein
MLESVSFSKPHLRREESRMKSSDSSTGWPMFSSYTSEPERMHGWTRSLVNLEIGCQFESETRVLAAPSGVDLKLKRLYCSLQYSNIVNMSKALSLSPYIRCADYICNTSFQLYDIS